MAISSLADWRRFIDAHLTGTFLCSKHALPALRDAHGAIVNIASSRALQSEPHTEAYASATPTIIFETIELRHPAFLDADDTGIHSERVDEGVGACPADGHGSEAVLDPSG